MCLIISNPQGVELPEIRLRTAYRNNRDGVGFMWHENGEVYSERGLLTLEEALRFQQMLIGKPHSIHFRLRTRGKVNVDSCHPFRVLNRRDHGFDLYMMHNGTIPGVPDSPTESDSMIFAHSLRAKLGTWENPMDFFEPAVLQKLGSNIGNNNRMVFYATGGISCIVNAKTGWFECPEEGALEIDTLDGTETPVWYSNQYSFRGLDPKTWYKTPLSFAPSVVKAEPMVEIKVETKSVTTYTPSAYPVVVRRNNGVITPVAYRNVG